MLPYFNLRFLYLCSNLHISVILVTCSLPSHLLSREHAVMIVNKDLMFNYIYHSQYNYSPSNHNISVPCGKLIMLPQLCTSRFRINMLVFLEKKSFIA